MTADRSIEYSLEGHNNSSLPAEGGEEADSGTNRERGRLSGHSLFVLGMPTVLKALEDAGLREGLQVIIGGAPVSQKFVEDIGVDAYAATAPQGV